jgi:hypothetical protein
LKPRYRIIFLARFGRRRITDGWDSLTFQETTSLTLQLLKEDDQNLFWDLDHVTKVANLYKSLLLLQVSILAVRT